VAYLRDITEHLKAEERFRRQSDLTAIITAHAAEPLFLLDVDNRITLANPAAERTFGWTAAEMHGTEFQAISGCRCDRDLPCPQVNEPGGMSCQHGPGAECHQALMFRKDGSPLDVVCSIAPILEDGKLRAGVLMVHDVTRQKHAERELLKVSRQMDSHLANAPLAVVELAPDYRVSRWTPGAERLFGWTTEEAVGKSLLEWPWLPRVAIPPQVLVADVPESAQDAAVSVMGIGNPEPPSRVVREFPESRRVATVTRSRTKDGRTVDVEWYHSELRDSSRGLVSVLGFGLDVTARNRAERALRESEARFRATFEQAAVGLVEVGIDGRILMVNEKLCQIVGRPAGLLTGSALIDLTHPDDRAGDYENLNVLLSGSIGPSQTEKRQVRPDGTVVWVKASFALVRDAAGQPCSLIGAIRDVSDQKEAEIALQQSRDRYRFLADSMPHLVFTATPEGEVDYCNWRWTDYTGRPAVDSAGRELTAVIHPDDLDGCRTKWVCAIASGEPYFTEARLRRVDGEYRWHRIQAARLHDEAGTILQWVGACDDIDDRKKAEARLERTVQERTAEAGEQARRAEAANQAKSEFLAMISHEIRSPMNIIAGMADLLWESELSAQQQEYLSILRKAGETLLAVINDILDLSAVEARRLRIEASEFDLSSVLDGALMVMRPRARTRKLELSCEVAPSVPKHPVGDAARVRQILLNLIGNAIKFTETGSVTLRVKGEPEMGPGGVSFAITDTGIGIPEDKHALIFEPFAQADSSITRKFGGTGLGLTISKQLVDLMGGRIWVESEPGQGSTFAFSVPFGVRPDPPDAPEAQNGLAFLTGANGQGPAHSCGLEPLRSVAQGPGAMAGRRPARILLADDSADNVFLVQAFLKDSAYLLDVVTDGAQAVAQVQQHCYDLILMDVQMPLMDGRTATRAIRAWEAGQRRAPVPVLALTAHALSNEVEKSLAAGCDAHLTKPIQRHALLQALERYVGGKAPVRIVASPPEGLHEVARQYLSRRRDGMRALWGWAASAEYDRIRGAAHDIKGTGASYGFPPLTETARELEQAASAKDLERLSRALRSMEDYLVAVEIAPAP
jgi:PAS domain S-box-containing protein